MAEDCTKDESATVAAKVHSSRPRCSNAFRFGSLSVGSKVRYIPRLCSRLMAKLSGQHTHEDEDDKPQLVVRSLKDFDSGYPNFATYLDSDESFTLFRRFGYLQSRLLLDEQEELRRLEAQLDNLDKSEEDSNPDGILTKDGQGEHRKELLAVIKAKFCDYAKLLRFAHDLRSFNKPSDSEHKSVVNYVRNEKPVHPRECQYLLCKEDLITLRPGREIAWLDRCIEKLLQPLNCRAVRYLFCSKDLQRKSSDSSQVYYSRDRIERCSTLLITIMILFLLVVPIYLLFHIVGNSHGEMGQHANAVCIGILLTFTLLFSAVMSLFTAARKHEILGAAAAYCAVLVVFLGNVGGVSRS